MVKSKARINSCNHYPKGIAHKRSKGTNPFTLHSLLLKGQCREPNFEVCRLHKAYIGNVCFAKPTWSIVTVP